MGDFEKLMQIRKEARDSAALDSMIIFTKQMVNVAKFVQQLPQAANFTDKMMVELMDSAKRNGDHETIEKVNQIAREMMKQGGLDKEKKS